MVVTWLQVEEQGWWTGVMAAAAKLMENTSGQPTLYTNDQIESLNSEYEWISERFNEFIPLESYVNAGLIQEFQTMASDDFGLPSDESGVPDGIVEDRFSEIKHLATIIEESHGDAFTAFRDDFILKLDVIWSNQALIARSLSNTAAIAVKTYNCGRADLMKLSERAIARFEMICARERGEDPAFEGQATALSTASLAIGLLGLIPGVGTAATLTSAAVGLASMASSDEKVEVPKEEVEGADGATYTITGETTDDVEASLRSALAQLESNMRDAETNLKDVINGFADLVSDPEQRDNIVAPDKSFPK